MKKIIISGALLAAGMVGATYYMGQKAKQSYLDWLSQVSANSELQASNSDYQSGLLSASATTHLRVKEPKLAQILSEHGLPTVLELQHHFQFLPWQASAQTQPVWQGQAKSLKALFGDSATPAVANYTLSLLGGAQLDLRLDMLQWRSGNDSLRLYPLDLQIAGQGKARHAQLNWNGLEWQQAANRLVLSGFKFDSQGSSQRQCRAQLGTMTLNQGNTFFSLNGLQVDSEVREHGNDIDRNSQWRADDAKYNADRFSQLALDLQMKNWNQRQLADTLREMLIVLTDRQDDGDEFLHSFTELLGKGGEIHFDNLKLVASNGELSGQGYLKLKAGKVDSLSQFMAQSEGEVQLSVPRHLGSLEPIDEDILHVLSERGWVKDDNQQLQLNFQINGSQLTLNQKTLATAL
ncbi:DUF945 family protein [Gallaecimonas sp. GXIMD1310]|uniref:DUF945 family protein n=1 Tax=Gallaecimonas sp. GXIMD1310 TaxID=3131926 RepID=UPI003251D899